MNCNNCYHEILTNSRFCANCGEKNRDFETYEVYISGEKLKSLQPIELIADGLEVLYFESQDGNPFGSGWGRLYQKIEDSEDPEKQARLKFKGEWKSIQHGEYISFMGSGWRYGIDDQDPFNDYFPETLYIGEFYNGKAHGEGTLYKHISGKVKKIFCKSFHENEIMGYATLSESIEPKSHLVDCTTIEYLDKVRGYTVRDKWVDSFWSPNGNETEFYFGSLIIDENDWTIRRDGRGEQRNNNERVYGFWSYDELVHQIFFDDIDDDFEGVEDDPLGILD